MPLKVYSRRKQLAPETPHVPVIQPEKGTNSIDLKKRQYTQHPLSHFVSLEKLSPSYKAFVSKLNSIETPKTVQEALRNDNWRKAMMEEMSALIKNNTWEVVGLPIGKRKVGCKWVFPTKFRADGTLERYKARLVAKGYTQTHVIDYHESFAPVVKMNTIRILLSLATNLDWSLQQLDVKNAFLHGDIEEEVYMEVPMGLEEKFEQGKVCKLKKALYGLKQSPRAWFGRFTKTMNSMGYNQSQGDHTLFFKQTEMNKVIALIVYVDDIALIGNDPAEMEKLKRQLAKEFEIKDLGKLKYFPRIEVAHSIEGIVISQQKYILDLLKET